jgi:hypothetical protein
MTRGRAAFLSTDAHPGDFLAPEAALKGAVQQRTPPHDLDQLRPMGEGASPSSEHSLAPEGCATLAPAAAPLAAGAPSSPAVFPPAAVASPGSMPLFAEEAGRGPGAPSFILDRRHCGSPQPWNLSRTVNRLRQAAGGIVTLDELVSAVFDCREDGGPLSARQVICDAVQTLRERGFPIERVANGRYRYASETVRYGFAASSHREAA